MRFEPILRPGTLVRSRSLTRLDEFEPSVLQENWNASRYANWLEEELRLGYLGESWSNSFSKFGNIGTGERNYVSNFEVGSWRRYPDTARGVWKWTRNRRASFSEVEFAEGGLAMVGYQTGVSMLNNLSKFFQR